MIVLFHFVNIVDFLGQERNFENATYTPPTRRCSFTPLKVRMLVSISQSYVFGILNCVSLKLNDIFSLLNGRTWEYGEKVECGQKQPIVQ